MLAAATGVLAVVAVAVFVAVGGNRAAAGKLPLAGGDLAAARFATETIAKPAAERVEAAPSARAFARSFVTVTNAYASAHGDPMRIGHADCVAAGAGRYMCSYKASRPGGSSECRIMQASWTPSRASQMTVTLAGRVPRCASLRDALRSLR